MKLVTKPINHDDIIDKSRHVTGFNKWVRSSPMINFIMLFFNWLCIPFEVIFRKDFGQRWFTVINFYSGFFLIILVIFLQSAFDTLGRHLHQLYAHFVHPLGPYLANQGGTSDNRTDIIQLLISSAYFHFGLYHRFKINWRNQSNIPLHSFDDGTSRLRWFAAVLVWILNIVMWPIMLLLLLFIPYKQRKGKPFPKFIANKEAFTTTVLEPLVVFLLGIECSGVVSIWLFISSVALLINSQIKEMSRKDKRLDFQDGRIEAEMMRALRAEMVQNKSSKPKKPSSKPKEKSRESSPQAAISYPSLNTIIDELHGVAKAKTPLFSLSIPIIHQTIMEESLADAPPKVSATKNEFLVRLEKWIRYIINQF